VEKEKALDNFIDMIEQSWTFDKMTKEERQRFSDLFHHTRTLGILKGTYKQRWEILQSIYFAYLMGLGYSPIGWRE
jgi:hypothetical protein